MPRVELATRGGELLGRHGEGGELAQRLRLELPRKERDDVARRVVGHVAEGVARDHLRELGPRAHEHLQLEAEARG